MVDKAIAHFKYGISHDIFKPPVLQYSELAVTALKKTKPMLVEHEKTFWTYRHYCPSCKDQLYMEALKYCNNCGQRLDWSNYTLELENVK